MGINDNVYIGSVNPARVIVRNVEGEMDLPDYGNDFKADYFDWNCLSPGAYKLGYCILAHEFGEEYALKYYVEFTEKYVSQFNSNWTMNTDELERAMMRMSSGG